MVRELVATGRPLTVDPKFVVASEVTFTFLFIIQRYSNYMQFCKCGVVTGGVTIGRRICVHVDVTVETGSRGSGALKPCASFSYPHCSETKQYNLVYRRKMGSHQTHCTSPLRVRDIAVSAGVWLVSL